MLQSEVSFQFTARYYKSGTITAATREVWIVLHGYGQLAPYFLKNFDVLEERNICVIAPEGLSRFYLEDVQSRARTGDNRVGATWMTRENRLADIENYLTYLNTIYEKEIGQSDIPVTVLGFSQGAATASRWVLNGTIRFRRLILWAGILPPDMNFEMGKEILQKKDVCLVYGKRDPFLHDDRFAEMKKLSDKLAITPRMLEFDGEHEIDKQTLLKLI